MLLEYPLNDVVEGWYFRTGYQGGQQFIVDGATLSGRHVSAAGSDPTALLAECAHQARALDRCSIPGQVISLHCVMPAVLGGAFAILFPTAWPLAGGTLHIPFLAFAVSATIGTVWSMVRSKRLERLSIAVDGLLCPACAHVLRPVDAEATCNECGRVYSVDELRSYWSSAFID